MFRPLRLAVAIVALWPSQSLRAGEPAGCVSSTCTCPDGRTVTGACDQDCATVCGASSPGARAGGLTPGQDLQLQTAYGVGQAIGTAFTKWLLSSPSADRAEGVHQQDLQRQRMLSYEQKLLQQQEQARIQAERKQREAAQSDFQKQRDSLMADLKDGSEKPLALKDPSTEQTLTGLKNQVRAMNCAMGEVYKAADGLGPEGAKINLELRRQLLEIYRELPTLELGASRPFSIDHMDSGKKGDAQFVLQGRISRDEATGNTIIDLNYALSKKGEEKRAGQSFLVLDTLGDFNCQHVTSAAAGCLARFNPASAAREYCPKPPPVKAQPGEDATKSDRLELKDD